MADDTPNFPHDRLVKWVFSRPEAAGVELRQALPPALSARIDWGSLVLRPDSLIDPKLRSRYSDLLYEAKLEDSAQAALLYVLIEHQSTPDRLMAWRLLRYMVRIWERFVRERKGSFDRLPLIVPVVLSQARTGWNQPRCLSALLDMPDDLREHYPSPVELRFHVDELGDSVLADTRAREETRALVQVARTLLRLAYRDDEVVPSIVAPLAPLLEQVMASFGVDDVEALWTYVITVFDHHSPLRDILTDAASPELKSVYVTIYDEAVDKGKRQGRREGRKEGRREGRKEGRRAEALDMLMRLLQRRGLALDPPQRQRLLDCADPEQLRRWFDRALEVETAAELFEPPGS